MLDVVKNRVLSDRFKNDTYCGVIKRYAQFTWYSEKRFQIPEDPLEWEDFILHEYKGNPIELEAWEVSLKTAFTHYFFAKEDITGGAYFYMTKKAYERRGPFNYTHAYKTIGKHVFLKYCKGMKLSCYHF